MQKQGKQCLEIKSASEFFALLEQHEGDLNQLGSYVVNENIHFAAFPNKFDQGIIPWTIRLGKGCFNADFSTFGAKLMDLYFENAGFRWEPQIQQDSIVRIYDDNHYFTQYGFGSFAERFWQVPSSRLRLGH